MHALIVTVAIDPAGLKEAQEQLRSQVVPRVKEAPGLVAGFWLNPKPSNGDRLEGSSMIVFDSEENARQAEQMAKNSPRPDSVTFTGFEIREVVAQV